MVQFIHLAPTRTKGLKFFNQICLDDIDFVNNKLELETKYDLHGVVNHYGTLGFGHYVSFTRNPFDQKWYKYDDINAEEVSEEKI